MVTMTAKAVFKCHPSSHHFDERHIRLAEAVKIGRSVAKARPTLDNGIFDCKVLSRNHALIWYDSSALKFFLQDTKSSNGTFVNNDRLSRGSEESPPHEICSGDVVQFGVDVMENSRRGVVTHGCIVAQLSLFHPDGTEATRSDSSLQVQGFGGQSVTGNNNVPSQELYQLSHYLKEALHREQMLEQKLAALQRLVSSTQEATESSWQALIDEDRLLSRLEVVENQLRAYSKANTEESIRKELVALQEDKSHYEKTVKESLKKSLEEKLEACRKLADTERMLSNSEDECAHVREELADLKKEQDLLLERYTQLETESQETMQRMTETDRLHVEEVEHLREEQQEIAERLGILQGVESSLGARAQELQAENDFLKEQLLATKERLEETQEALKQAVGEAQLSIAQPSDQPLGEEVDGNGDVTKASEDAPPVAENGGGTEGRSDEKKTAAPAKKIEIPVRTSHHISLLPNGDDRTPTRESGVQVESLWREAASKERSGKVNETDGATENSVKTLKNSAEDTVLREVLRYKFKLEEAQQRLSDSDKSIASLQSEVSQAREEVQHHRDQVAALEERLREAEENTRVAVERAVSELRERLSGSFDSVGDHDLSNDNDSETSSISSIQTLVDEPLVAVREEERQFAAAPSEGTLVPSASPVTSASSPSTSSSISSASSEDKKEAGFHNHIHVASMSNSKDLEASMQEIDTLKDELGALKQKCSQLSKDNEDLSKQLQATQQEAKLATDRAKTLQSKLQEAESQQSQLPVLQEKLDLERQLVQKRTADIEGLNKKLKEAASTASNNQTELAHCRDHIISLSGALERETDVRQRLEKDVEKLSAVQEEVASQRKERQRLEDRTKQLQLKIAQLEERLERQQAEQSRKDDKISPTESGDLKTVMTTMEADLQRSYQEKERLCDEILRLKSVLKETISERDKLKEQSAVKEDVAGVLAEKESLQRQLKKLQGELEQGNSSTPSERPEVESLKQRLESVTQELHRAKTNNAMLQIKWVPVCVIGIAIVAAVIQSILAMRLEV